MIIRRGDVVWVEEIKGEEGSEIRCWHGRPWLVVSNNVGNAHSTTILAAAITTRAPKWNFPCHVGVGAESGVYSGSVQTEQIRTIAKKRISKICGRVPEEIMDKVDYALEISLGLAKE